MSIPTEPGVFRFEGYRKYSARNDMREVRAVVYLKPYKWGAKRGLAVFFFGNAKPYRPDTFDGEWDRLSVDYGGEMLQ